MIYRTYRISRIEPFFGDIFSGYNMIHDITGKWWLVDVLFRDCTLLNLFFRGNITIHERGILFSTNQYNGTQGSQHCSNVNWRTWEWTKEPRFWPTTKQPHLWYGWSASAGSSLLHICNMCIMYIYIYIYSYTYTCTYTYTYIDNWLVVWTIFLFFHILGMSSSQLTNSYFSEGLLNHQPDKLSKGDLGRCRCKMPVLHPSLEPCQRKCVILPLLPWPSFCKPFWLDEKIYPLLDFPIYGCISSISPIVVP